jgi:hypothetical protein
MVSVLELVTTSMQDIGAIAPGEAATAQEANFALSKLNGMFELWSTEELMVYGVDEEEFSLVAEQAVYTMGDGGDFDTDRPVKIARGVIRDSSDNDYPLEVTTSEQDYVRETAKSEGSPVPCLLYDDNAFPQKNLTFFPAPSDATYSVVLWVWRVFSEFSSLNEEISLPPGYREALESNLSIRLCPSFGKVASAELIEIATESKAQIKRNNYRFRTLGCETTRGGAYDYRTGR